MKNYILAPGALFILAAAALPAWADCNTAAQKTAAEQNGKLTKVTPAKDKNGKDICIVVVSVPSTDGEKPRRVELAVPADK